MSEFWGYLETLAAFHASRAAMEDNTRVWNLVEPHTTGFQAYLEHTGHPALCPTFTSVSDTARHQLSRTYRLPGAEIKKGIAAFIKPEQDLREAQEKCTTVPVLRAPRL